MTHRKLTEQERNRMLDVCACGPLVYRSEIDFSLFQLGLLRWYDPDTRQEVEHNPDVPFFSSDGSILPEWYDFKAKTEEPTEVEITIDFKCRFSIAQSGCPTREAALADAMQEWGRIKGTINNMLDYVTITEVSEPVVKSPPSQRGQAKP